MKIAMVTSWNVRCGIATYARDLALALAQQDVETLVVRLPRFGTKSQELMLRVAERVPYLDVDLVHVQHEYGLYQGFEAPFFTAMRQHGKPIVTTMHAVGNWELDVLLSGVSNRVIVHNKTCAKRFPFPSVMIPHGVAMAEPTERVKAKALMGIHKDVPIVGYLGFISNYKGLETLISAMTKVTNAGLLICGGWHADTKNDYIDRLQQWSKKLLGNRVLWKGFVPEESLADAYGAMDVLVYPSRFATESGALLHGIGYGKAIIASDVDSFKEKEEDGALTTFSGEAGLADKIANLLKDADTRSKLELGAREYAKENSWARVAEKHVALYKQLQSV